MRLPVCRLCAVACPWTRCIFRVQAGSVGVPSRVAASQVQRRRLHCWRVLFAAPVHCTGSVCSACSRHYNSVHPASVCNPTQFTCHICHVAGQQRDMVQLQHGRLHRLFHSHAMKARHCKPFSRQGCLLPRQLFQLQGTLQICVVAFKPQTHRHPSPEHFSHCKPTCQP